MPIYEYYCKQCNKNFEKLVRLGTEQLICPNCGNISKKIISQCTFTLKGSGWYTDGYSKDKNE